MSLLAVRLQAEGYQHRKNAEVLRQLGRLLGELPDSEVAQDLAIRGSRSQEGLADYCDDASRAAARGDYLLAKSIMQDAEQFAVEEMNWVQAVVKTS